MTEAEIKKSAFDCGMPLWLKMSFRVERDSEIQHIKLLNIA